MAVLKAEDIPDMVQGTLLKLGRMRFRQIAQKLQKYEVLPKWMKKDKVSFDSGYGIRENLMTKLTGAARHTGLFEKDALNIADVLDHLEVRWAHATVHWGFEYRETLMNRGESLIVKILKPRRMAAMLDLAQMLEEAAWTLPSPKDKKSPYGIPYWITTSTVAGFNGMAPQGYSTVAGIDPNDVEGFRNYTDAYSDITKADLIKKMRKGQRAIEWESPITEDDVRGDRGSQMRIYCNDNTYGELEEVGENQTENPGRDLYSIAGMLTFKRHPIIPTRMLDRRADNPIYMVDHGTWYPVILKGDYLRESKPKALDESHNTFVTHVDLSYNYVCVDRRRNAAFIKN